MIDAAGEQPQQDPVAAHLIQGAGVAEGLGVRSGLLRRAEDRVALLRDQVVGGVDEHGGAGDVQGRLSASFVGHRDDPLVLCAVVLLLHGRRREGGDDALGEGLRAGARLGGRVGDDRRLVGGRHGVVPGGEVARGLDDHVGVRQRERTGGEGFTRAREALLQGVRIGELLRRGVGGDPQPCGELADHGSFGLLESVLPRSDLIEEQPHPFGESLRLPGVQPGDLAVDLRALLDQRRAASERVVGGEFHAFSLERSTDTGGENAGSVDNQFRTYI